MYMLSVDSALASAQLGTLMKLRNLKLQYKYLNMWRLGCESSKCVARTSEELSGRLARLEADYKQEIAELQGRLDRSRDSYRANVIEHLERIHQKASCRRAVSLWKTAVIRALACAKAEPQTVDEGTMPLSPSLEAVEVDDNRAAALEEELAGLQEQIRFANPKCVPQPDRLTHRAYRLKDEKLAFHLNAQLKLKVSLLVRQIARFRECAMRQAFYRWRQHCIVDDAKEMRKVTRAVITQGSSSCTLHLAFAVVPDVRQGG